jgi:hypothetical protein
LIAFLKTLQRLKQKWQKRPALGPGKNLVWFREIERKLAKLSMPPLLTVLPLNYFMSQGFASLNGNCDNLFRGGETVLTVDTKRVVQEFRRTNQILFRPFFFSNSGKSVSGPSATSLSPLPPVQSPNC